MTSHFRLSTTPSETIHVIAVWGSDTKQSELLNWVKSSPRSHVDMPHWTDWSSALRLSSPTSEHGRIPDQSGNPCESLKRRSNSLLQKANWKSTEFPYTTFPIPPKPRSELGGPKYLLSMEIRLPPSVTWKRHHYIITLSMLQERCHTLRRIRFIHTENETLPIFRRTKLDF
jgi:hypothetical protein